MVEGSGMIEGGKTDDGKKGKRDATKTSRTKGRIRRGKETRNAIPLTYTGADRVCAGMPGGGSATCLFLRDANSWQG